MKKKVRNGASEFANRVEFSNEVMNLMSSTIAGKRHKYLGTEYS